MPSPSPRLSNRVQKGVILGTVNYMSPEQARGEKLDERTDIFSLGAVIYEMIAGKTPFQGNSLVETLANLINSELQPLALYDANLPDEFDRIVSRMLKKSAGERYQKMEDLLVDLRTLQRRLDFEAETGRTSPPNKQIETARGGQITVDKKDEKEAGHRSSGGFQRS